jgi:hypothetical protein
MRKTADRAKSWNFGMASFSLIRIDYEFSTGADACAPLPVRLTAVNYRSLPGRWQIKI